MDDNCDFTAYDSNINVIRCFIIKIVIDDDSDMFVASLAEKKTLLRPEKEEITV